MAVSWSGAVPVAVEPSKLSFNIDVDLIEAAIIPRTRAIITVYLCGQPAEMDAINQIADRYGLMMLEDATQAHGARYQGCRTGGLGQATSFSFYSGKNHERFVTRRDIFSLSLSLQ